MSAPAQVLPPMLLQVRPTRRPLALWRPLWKLIVARPSVLPANVLLAEPTDWKTYVFELSLSATKIVMATDGAFSDKTTSVRTTFAGIANSNAMLGSGRSEKALPSWTRVRAMLTVGTPEMPTLVPAVKPTVGVFATFTLGVFETLTLPDTAVVPWATVGTGSAVVLTTLTFCCGGAADILAVGTIRAAKIKARVSAASNSLLRFILTPPF